MSQPRLKPTVEAFESCDGDIQLIRAGGDTYTIEQPSALDRALVAALDGRRTRAQLRSDLGADASIEPALAQLAELGVLEDAADPARGLLGEGTAIRFDQQLQYFSEIGDEPGAAVQADLRGRRVVVVGAGGLGTWAMLALACAGLGRVDVHDGDVVELGNLNRQVIYTPAELGSPKAEIAAARLAAFDPELDVRAHGQMLGGVDDIRAAIHGADAVVGAADWPLHRFSHWLDEACFLEGVPYISAGVICPFVRIGPLFHPGQSGCLLCLEAAYRARDPEFDALVRFRRTGRANTATTGAACGLVGAIVGSELTHLLTGLATPATLGVALTVDLRTLGMSREAVPARPDCARCGPGRDQQS
jgi:bacteriocin biosynthesis cyclodehydratase domain-containing protein